ncbi:hypothetical protein BJY24_005346 [Nocardia transvalensis]|uniref:Uncharacterized protein n=1 Tax=Nocardia transvalensis TaxID=37333 RepID=A0A7W9PHV7_9NOCA|nr:hypothetical protein [Nocardia transvalensis]MBB5916434.1 hypothetical protein [Nocardia transvalensis]
MPTLAARLHDVITTAGACDTAAQADALATRLERLIREFGVGAYTGEDRARLALLCSDATTAVHTAAARTGADTARPAPRDPDRAEDEPVIRIEDLFGLPPQRARYRARDWNFYRRRL